MPVKKPVVSRIILSFFFCRLPGRFELGPAKIELRFVTGIIDRLTMMFFIFLTRSRAPEILRPV